jgi:hypothetical protein
MTRILKFLGISACALAIAVHFIGVAVTIPEAIAQNTTKKGSGEGPGVPQNATDALSSSEAMNNTFTPMGPEN